MDGMSFLRYLPYVVSSVFVLVGLPLAFNMVAPNGGYGIRIARTLADAETWYAVNHVGGVSMVVCGLLSMVIVFSLHKYWGVDSEIKVILPVFVPAVMVLISVSITLNIA